MGRSQSEVSAHAIVDAIKASGAHTIQCYGAEFGCEHVYCYAKSKGLITVANLYITGDPDNDAREKQSFQEVQECVDRVNVGSNLITFGGMSVNTWLTKFNDIDALTTKPVGIAELPDTLVNNASVLGPKLKHIWLNNLVFFESPAMTPQNAVSLSETDYAEVVSAYQGYQVPVIGGEYGWATSSTPADSRATLVNAQDYHCRVLGSSIPVDVVGLYSWIDEPGLNFNPFLPNFGIYEETGVLKFSSYPFLCN